MPDPTTERCEACHYVRPRGGSLLCHLEPRPVHVAPGHWCSHYAVGPTVVTEAEVDAALAGLDERRAVRMALWVMKTLDRP